MVALSLSRYLSRPIIELAHAADRLAKGDLSSQIKIKATGEIQILAESFNQMIQDLQQTTVSRDYIDNIIKTMLDALIVISPQGKMQTVNDAACKLLGYEEKELVGQQVNMIFDRELLSNRSEVDRSEGDSSEGDDGFIKNLIGHREAAYRAKDGRTIPILFSASILRKGNSDIQGVICMAQDITERKHAEEKLHRSQQNLQTIINFMPYGIFLISMDKKILSANKAALALTGYESEKQLAGKVCHQLCPFQVDKCPIIDLKQKSDTSERILISKDGRRIPIFKAVVPIEIDGSDVLLEAVIDITESKHAEKELRSFAAKLEKSNKELEAFAYIASHDLQEPLRKVMAFGERLKAKWGESLHDQGRDYMERMQNATLRMQTLINDLLAFSRVTSKVQPFIPVDLNAAVREVSSDLEVKIEQLKGHIDIDNLPVIEADPLQMRQLFQNLIGNALKFHKPEESPVVTVKSEKMNGNGNEKGNGEIHHELYQITVEDNGIGFDEKYLDRIFGVFQRLHGRNEYEGTGIGLSICRKIVERHNGNITAKSTPGEGSSFIVTLPAKQIKGENNV